MKLPQDNRRAQLYAQVERKIAQVEKENRELKQALREPCNCGCPCCEEPATS